MRSNQVRTRAQVGGVLSTRKRIYKHGGGLTAPVVPSGPPPDAQ
jgi:pyruvate kinase